MRRGINAQEGKKRRPISGIIMPYNTIKPLFARLAWWSCSAE